MYQSVISSENRTVKTFVSSDQSISDKLLDEVRKEFYENNMFQTADQLPRKQASSMLVNTKESFSNTASQN